jgi:hypothetical protein
MAKAARLIRRKSIGAKNTGHGTYKKKRHPGCKLNKQSIN